MDKNETNFIEIDEATQFIYENIFGEITKEELDKQRNKERNSVDMMLT